MQLKHLCNAETRFDCPQMVLYLEHQCRNDVSELKLTFWEALQHSMIGSMISLVPPDSHLSIRLVRRRRLLPPQVAEEEAENLEAGPEEEEEEENESMDEAEGSLPSLGKRRSTDTALSGQTSAKRSRPGSLAEVRLPSLKHLTICAFIPVSIYPLFTHVTCVMP